MIATLYPLHGPPIPWHTIGIVYLTHLHVSNGFDSVMLIDIVDHMTRMAHFLPCIESVTTWKLLVYFRREQTDYTDCPEYWLLVTATRNSSAAFDKHLEDALERDSTCLLADTRGRMD
jgi:hypothetical protein